MSQLEETPAEYLPFSPQLEQPTPDEQVVIDELSRTMQHITRSMAERYRHAYRPVHAKSHGILVGRMETEPGLPEPLAQGLFAGGRSYPVIMRFSTNPGDMLADNVSSPRGLAVKVLEVEGEMLPGHEGQATQDFVCINADAFGAPDAKGFLDQLKLLDKTLHLPEELKHAVSLGARAANATIGVVGLHSAALEALGAPATHILGESFSTVAPLRYGAYVAKVGFAPGSENLKRLVGEGIDLGADYNALEELILRFFRHETAVWEVRVQLALAEGQGVADKDRDFPIEKADTPWPEKRSPWRTVAQITVEPQETYSDQRQLFADERLSFSPWHGLGAHQPLGGVMRARKKAYEEAFRYRLARNGRAGVEPKSMAEVPA